MARKLSGSTGDPDRDREARASLIEGCLPQIRDAYRKALSESIEQPVIFLVNLLDADGYAFAVKCDGEEAVENFLAANAGRVVVNTTPTLAFAVPFADLPAEKKAQLSSRSAGIPFVCVSSGGTSQGYIPETD